MNTWIGTGRLTDAPVVRSTQSGNPVCSFTIAIDEYWGKGDDEKKTTFVPIIVWGKVGENCGKYLEKGQLVNVRGRLQIRSYTDKDGIKRRAAEIVASEVEFGAKAKHSGTEAGKEPEEDIPF